MASNTRPVHFVTGNAGKLAEVQSIVGNAVHLVIANVDLPELQGATAQSIAEEKVKTACAHLGKDVDGDDVLIEDTSLSFGALGGNLPGPYIKWFLKDMKNEGIIQMVQKIGDTRAVASCIFTMRCGASNKIEQFVGSLEGHLVAPRGDKGFGWDVIFEPVEQPAGYVNGTPKRTFAEMTSEEKNTISHRAKSLEKLKAHYAAKAERQHEKRGREQ